MTTRVEHHCARGRHSSKGAGRRRARLREEDLFHCTRVWAYRMYRVGHAREIPFEHRRLKYWPRMDKERLSMSGAKVPTKRPSAPALGTQHVVLTGEIRRLKGPRAVCPFVDPSGRQFMGTCDLGDLSRVPHEAGARFAFKAVQCAGEHRLFVEPLTVPDPRDDAAWREENRRAGERYKDFESGRVDGL